MGKPDFIRIALIQSGPTAWDLDERLVGQADLPLADPSAPRAHATAESWRDDALFWADAVTIVCGPDEASRATAGVLASHLGQKFRAVDELADHGLGLWEGSREAELIEKCPSAFRQWKSDPRSVTPPEAEPWGPFEARVLGALSRVVSKLKGADPLLAIVVRPLAYEAVRAVLGARAEQISKEPAEDEPAGLRHTLYRAEPGVFAPAAAGARATA